MLSDAIIIESPTKMPQITHAKRNEFNQFHHDYFTHTQLHIQIESEQERGKAIQIPFELK